MPTNHKLLLINKIIDTIDDQVFPYQLARKIIRMVIALGGTMDETRSVIDPAFKAKWLDDLNDDQFDQIYQEPSQKGAFNYDAPF